MPEDLYAVPESVFFPEFRKTLTKQDGKTVLITGTTSGTGYIAARVSLELGATVVMLNRNSSRAEDVLREFQKDYAKTVFSIECDLMSFESVKKCATEVKKKFTRVDVLVNNAGVMGCKDEPTQEGYDIQMQVNHLSHFLLTKELFPLLKSTAKEVGESRVISMSSGARNYPPWPLCARYLEKKGGQLGGDSNHVIFGKRAMRYHQSKLACAAFACELSDRLEAAKSKVRSICAHPGLTSTELQAKAHKIGGFPKIGIMNKAQSAEDGSMGLLLAMFSSEVKNGKLYGPRFWGGVADERYYGPFVYKSAMTMLWEKSEEACGKFETWASALAWQVEAPPTAS